MLLVLFMLQGYQIHFPETAEKITKQIIVWKIVTDLSVKFSA